MSEKINNRIKSVENRLKSKRKLKLHIFLVFIVVSTFFIFSNNIVVDEKTGSVAIVEIPKVKKENFTKVYSGKIGANKTLDFDIDLTDVIYTGSIVDIEFSNNKTFTLFPIGSKTNITKVKYGYMLGKSRNKNKVFWVGKITESLKRVQYNVLENQEDGRLYFRGANLGGGDLYVKITLKGEKNIKNKKD